MTISPGMLVRSVLALLPLSFPFSATAQHQPAGAYAPSLGDVMTIVQLRHAKVWYAATLGNWPLAAYELDRLADSLRQARAIHGGAPAAPEADENGIGPVADATRRMDQASFDAAFAGLTESCNACHSASGVGFIAIRAPT